MDQYYKNLVLIIILNLNHKTSIEHTLNNLDSLLLLKIRLFVTSLFIKMNVFIQNFLKNKELIHMSE